MTQPPAPPPPPPLPAVPAPPLVAVPDLQKPLTIEPKVAPQPDPAGPADPFVPVVASKPFKSPAIWQSYLHRFENCGLFALVYVALVPPRPLSPRGDWYSCGSLLPFEPPPRLPAVAEGHCEFVPPSPPG